MKRRAIIIMNVQQTITIYTDIQTYRHACWMSYTHIKFYLDIFTRIIIIIVVIKNVILSFPPVV